MLVIQIKIYIYILVTKHNNFEKIKIDLQKNIISKRKFLRSGMRLFIL